MSNSATLWTVAPQAPLSIGFPRQGYWSGLPFAEKEKIQRKEGGKKEKISTTLLFTDKDLFFLSADLVKIVLFFSDVRIMR